MPVRLLRDWTDSEAVNALSPEAEVCFVRLIQKADDFGRFSAAPKLLRPVLFPLRVDDLTEREVGSWLAEIRRAGLASFYEIDGRPYLEIRKFGQRVRAAASRFPAPPSPDTCPSDDRQVTDTRRSNDGLDVVVCGDGSRMRETKTEPPVVRSERRPPRGGRVRSTPEKRFTPPTVEEVRAEVTRRSLTVDAEAFVAFYESKGWRVGTSPMRSWPAALTTWARRAPDRASPGQRPGFFAPTKSHEDDIRRAQIKAGKVWDPRKGCHVDPVTGEPLAPTKTPAEVRT